MKRREFNFGILAAGVTPLVKIPVAASAVPTASTAANFTPFMYASGTQLARFHGSCSAELLATRLGLSPEAARAISARMIKNGIITAPNALGISQPTGKYAPKPKPEAHSPDPSTHDHKQRIKLLEDDAELPAKKPEEEHLGDTAQKDNIAASSAEADTTEI